MAQPKKKVSLNQVLKLVAQLTPEELLELQRTVNNKTWGQRFHQLADEIERDRVVKGLSRLSDEEIMTEVKAVREEMKAERVQQSQSGN